MRVALIRLAENASFAVWSHHHILLDGWSMSILFGEVMTLYNAYAEGGTLNLAPVLPYRDFIGWLHRRDRNEAKAFWARYLKDSPPTTNLGGNLDNALGLETDYLVVALSTDLTARLHETAKKTPVNAEHFASRCLGLATRKSFGPK